MNGQSTLNIEGAIAAGNTVDLTAGNFNTITINDQWYVVQSPAATVGGSPSYTGSPPVIGATITNFNGDDQLIFVDDAQNGITLTSISYTTDGTLDLMDGTVVVSSLAVSIVDDPPVVTGTFELGTPISSPFTGQTEQVISLQENFPLACFAAGTSIATPRGAVAVEHLAEGDMVLTISGWQQPILWIGRRTLDCRRHPAPALAWPVRIAAHAFGEDRPKRPLLLSPDHAVFVENVLIPIKHLINGTTVAQVEAATVTYYHIELPNHDVVFAEGLPAESYLDIGDRSAFENGGGVCNCTLISRPMRRACR